MRRGAKPAKANGESKRPVARKSRKREDSKVADLEKRLAEAVDQQTATAEILRVISSSPTDVQPVFDAIVAHAVRLCDGQFGVVYRCESKIVSLAAHHNLTEEGLDWLRQRFPRPLSQLSTRAILDERVVQISDFETDPTVTEEMRTGARLRGSRANVTVPLLRDHKCLGLVIVGKNAPGYFPDKQVALLQIFADQAVIAIENVRLFKEIEDKSRQLEVASQHKSEFLANMSHELRTPLNAVIGFSEVLLQQMFGELNTKQDEYLKDIYASGQHLLSLINDILDLSKIEAGRMELELTDFHLPQAIDNALMLVRERAGRRAIALESTVDERVGEIRADERKIRQVVLNLLSNAIKFTPEGGRIEVAAVPRDEVVEVSVSDTGIGIASEDQEAVFEEFRQVGTAAKKVEGTGLGLALSRKFVELHGGRIWVQSQVGIGSTFTFTIPVRRRE
jgi:signal transduction histidine kinase